MSASALWRKRVVVFLRLALDPTPHWWWRQRWRAVEKEFLRRG
jgi:hypothetical protein